MPQGIARVSVRPRSLIRRAPPAIGVQVAVAAAFRKGPMRPTLVTGQTDMLRRFTPNGSIPVDADDGHWSAFTYLDDGDQAWFRRVAPQATFANLVIGQAHDRDNALGKTDVLWTSAAGTDGSITSSSVTSGTSGYLGEQADDAAADTAASGSTGADNDVYINTDFKVVREYDSGWSTITGADIDTALGRTVTGAKFIGFLDDDGVVAYFANNAIAAFSTAGTTVYLFADTDNSDDLKQVNSYTAASGGTTNDLADDENASSTGSVHLTNDDAVIDVVSPFSNSPLSEDHVTDWNEFDGAVNQQADNRKAAQLTLIYAASPGAWGNTLKVSVHEYDVLDGRADVSAGEVREIRVQENGIQVETWVVSRTNGLKDGRGESLYIEDVLRRNSEYIRAVDSAVDGFLETVNSSGNFTGADYTGSDTLSNGSLANGSDGATPEASDYSAAYEDFENVNVYPNIKLILDGGQSNATVATKIGDVAKDRVNSQGILNLPLNAFASGWRDNASDTGLARGYIGQAGIPKIKEACAFGPRLLMTDEFNRREIYVPVDGVMAGNISRAAEAGRPYDPPVGPELGQITGFLDVKERLTDAELGYMVDTLKVNPIRYEAGYGLNFWDQLTLEAIPTGENDLHVRLMLMDINPRLQRHLRSFLFRGNNPAQRRLVYTQVTNFMRGVERQGGVDRFEVVCDATNNTIVEEQQQRMVVWLFIWPVGVTKYIDLYPILTPRGVSINDAVEAIAA